MLRTKSFTISTFSAALLTMSGLQVLLPLCPALRLSPRIFLPCQDELPSCNWSAPLRTLPFCHFPSSSGDRNWMFGGDKKAQPPLQTCLLPDWGWKICGTSFIMRGPFSYFMCYVGITSLSILLFSTKVARLTIYYRNLK